jgi:hypothetical protein
MGIMSVSEDDVDVGEAETVERLLSAFDDTRQSISGERKAHA